MRQGSYAARVAAVLAAIAVVGLAAGCSSSKESTNASASVPAAGRANAIDGGAAVGAAPSKGAAPSSAKSALAKSPVPGRSLVYTASMTIRTKDVAGATAKAETLAAANGGFVGDEKSQSGTVPDVKGLTQSTVTLRVPSTAFDTVIGQLGSGGTVQDETRSASDVTSQVVDTGTRITAQQASIARITTLMKNAANISDVVSLEGELSRREADLESMQAQLAALKDQVSLSTITVTYLVPEAPAVAKPAPKHHNALERGLHNGWRAFVGAVNALLVVFGVLLPFAVVVGVLWWPVTRLARLWTRMTRRVPGQPVVGRPPARAEEEAAAAPAGPTSAG